jgi:hypothetical protein
MPNGYLEMEDIEDLAEELEDFTGEDYDEEEDDLAERRRRRVHRAPRTGSGGSLYRSRETGYVTQTQLQAALTRVGSQIRTNSEAIKTLNSRVATLSSDQARQATALRKETALRKRETAALRNELRQTSQNNLLLFLLTQPKTTDPTTRADKVGNADVPIGARLVVQEGDSSKNLLLPILMLSGGGFGGGGNSQSGSGGGGSNDALLMAVAFGAL